MTVSIFTNDTDLLIGQDIYLKHPTGTYVGVMDYTQCHRKNWRAELAVLLEGLSFTFTALTTS